MKRIVIINLLFICLGLVSCASSRALQQCQDDLAGLNADMIALKVEVKQMDDTLDKALKSLEAMQFEMGVIRRELFSMKKGGKPLPDSEVAQLIDKLKDDKVNIEVVSEEFLKYGKVGLSALLYVLKTPDLDFRKRVESVLEYMPSKDVLPVLNDALKEPASRISATHVLGNLDDASAVPMLAEYLRDDNLDFRLAIVEALVKLRDKRGIPALIEYLKSDNEAHRALAFDTLGKVTGQTFDYKHYALEDERREAVRKWETWWLRQGATFKFSRMEKFSE